MSKLVKYPRTFHLPWSPGATDDDKTLDSTDCFKNKEVVVTLKIDGENTTMMSDVIHARSLTTDPHPSRDFVKGMWAEIQHDIPKDWRIVGENVYAKHSIAYTDLESYFFVFSIWDENEICFSWDDTITFSKLLNLKTVPVIYQGIYDEEKIQQLYQPTFEGNEMEGYVVRLADSFPAKDFSKSVGKMVRKNHVITDEHWKHSQIIMNKLRE